MSPTTIPPASAVRLPLARGQRLALLCGFALLVALRLPQAWVHGRFLGEEGTIFFAYAWHRPALDALFRAFGGYLNLGANATTLAAARLVQGGALPLEAAPYVTMVAALLCQLLPAVLILTGRARWLAPRWAVVASLLVIALSPMTEEVFVNVLHIQFHLALCVGLILALDVPEGRAARAGTALILFLAPLCGPGAIILFPVLMLRSIADRDRERMVQAAILGLGIAVQMLLFFSRSPVRGDMIGPTTLGAILFVRLEALPYLAPLANKIGKWVYRAYLGEQAGWRIVAAAAAAGYFAALLALAWRDRRDAALWLVLAAIVVAVVSFSGGMIASDPHEWFSVGAGQRYNFLPLVLLGLALVVLAARGARYSIACAVLLGLSLVMGAIFYFRPVPELRDGPAWPAEVAAWRRDHSYPLVAWPRSWTVDLSDRDRPCSPLSAGAVASDPTYCEASWLAHVARDLQAARASSRQEQAERAARKARKRMETR